MIITLESLLSFNRVLELKLDLRIDGRELKRDLINQLACQRVVGPALQELMSLVLQVVLSTSEEETQVLLGIGWAAPILYLL